MILSSVSRLLRNAARTQLVPRARISSQPPEEPLTAVDLVVGITALSVVILGPSCWILSHLEDYKKRP
ncbi:cytochrome c oxidase subunit 8A, mitochondrial [Thalassophryne amazonica]|uniref:cytochrome c oxidase subunit 8A, mitochondrial n=1 Tax=Thalassophryne amazonica TaxID=390379 RepID=UPI001471428F|nr:cytochrome c oxidase subunit 8A, mitochondrial [Thalassophryne amazonica]